jgi:hypothetical protein
LAYRLQNDRGDIKITVGKVAVNHWLPGSINLFTEEFFKHPADLPPGDVNEVQETIPMSPDLASGDYTLAIAVVGEKDEEPVVRLGIKGRAGDGWYPLSKVAVVRY